MCFVNECDWSPMVNEEADIKACGCTKCDECHAVIEYGDSMHTIYQQESEECLQCRDGWCECEGDCCECSDPDFGETFDYVRCEQCDKFLKAVEAAEIEAGCGPHEARPMLSMMVEDINNGGREEARKYFKKAKAMFPELVASGYLGGLWRKMF
jgi:hypothetical protein